MHDKGDLKMIKQSILCVDDEKFVLTSLKEQLKSKIGNRCSIELAESAQDALEILKELSDENIEIPLVISDYIMPGMNGDELLEIIHNEYPKTINILLTGQATLNGVINSINKASLYRYITKPWIVEDLTLAVIEALKSYDKDRRIEAQNKKLKEQNEELLSWTEAIVEAMSTVLDTRDTTTSGHSKRIANYAVRLANAINSADYGKYSDFTFSDNEIKELYYAALLHDIGKMGIREQILLKDHPIPLDRESAICYKLNWYYEVLKLKMENTTLDENEMFLLKNIPYYISFIHEINNKDYVSCDEVLKVKKISLLKLVDIDGIEKNLLDDYEIENLSVNNGNLTKKERDIINLHAEYTYNILKEIPWPEHLTNVPEIASNHHERLNGSGYYKGLSGDDISVASRILAILDVYEALTSPDRPYKELKTPEEALQIIQSEVLGGNFDEEIFRIFIQEKIYE